MPEEDVITSAIDFLSKISQEEEVNIKFTKKDGTTRLMRCTLKFNKIPKNKQPKSIEISKFLKLIKDSMVVHVFDLEKRDWRSVPFNRVEWLKTPTTMYRIRAKKGV